MLAVARLGVPGGEGECVDVERDGEIVMERHQPLAQPRDVDLLRDLQREQGMGLMLITHDLAVVAGMAQRVALMYAGQVVEVAEAKEFFARPLHPYAVNLFEALPDTAKRGRRLASSRLSLRSAGTRYTQFDILSSV